MDFFLFSMVFTYSLSLIVFSHSCIFPNCKTNYKQPNSQPKCNNKKRQKSILEGLSNIKTQLWITISEIQYKTCKNSFVNTNSGLLKYPRLLLLYYNANFCTCLTWTWRIVTGEQVDVNRLTWLRPRWKRTIYQGTFKDLK
jgi:hypothetical protein